MFMRTYNYHKHLGHDYLFVQYLIGRLLMILSGVRVRVRVRVT